MESGMAMMMVFLTALTASGDMAEGYSPYGEFDFIVVGAGSAGAVVANRLSEVPEWKVLLVEAGGEAPRMTDVPYLALVAQRTPIDWGYYPEKDGRTCLSLDNQTSYWPRGKVLGGTSVLNFMQYVRGNRHDYDLWRSLGNPGWGYDDVLPYFKKSEDYQGETCGVNMEYHGKGGYLGVQGSDPFKSKLADILIEAGKEMGYPKRDCNGMNQTGFMFMQRTTRGGARSSTARAFLDPIKGRRNLHIATFAQVVKIHIDERTKQAHGVFFRQDGKIFLALVRKEVILCAGAIGSPHLLMLSGIGPKKNLQDAGVQVIHDLPGVGQNLQDHVATFLYVLANTGGALEPLSALHPFSVLAWLAQMPSPLSTPGGGEVMGFVHTKYSNPSEDWPDIQFITLSTSPLGDPTAPARPPFAVSKEAFSAVYGEIMGKEAWLLAPLLLRPESRGQLILKSSDPDVHPVIYPNYFTHEKDIKVLIEGCKIAEQMTRTRALQGINSQIWMKPFPGCENHVPHTDDFWECMLRHKTLTVYHPVGTCKMGHDSDPGAVLDPLLRVRGIRGLRVADCAIMPTLVSANTNAGAIMIGEKASDLIKDSWPHKPVAPRK